MNLYSNTNLHIPRILFDVCILSELTAPKFLFPKTHPLYHLHYQNLVSEAAQKKERDLVTREIERLRSSIQTVCRSTLPLGKIMDYIQEDMDAMQAELHTWRRENKEHAQALLQEQRWGWHILYTT